MTTSLEEVIGYAMAMAESGVMLLGDGGYVRYSTERKEGKAVVKIKADGVKRDDAWNCFFNFFLSKMRDYPYIKSK